MKRFGNTIAALLLGGALQGGALLLEVGNPQANPEAAKLGALLVVRATACSAPEKSAVTANLLRLEDGQMRRVPLTVKPLSTPGTFAVIGDSGGAHAAIELAVRNPEYRNYEPTTLVRLEGGAIQWSSLKRFFSVPPNAADLRAMLL